MEGNYALLVAELVLLAVLAAWPGSAVWAYRDAMARGTSGVIVGAVVLMTWPFGLLGWLLLRGRFRVNGDAREPGLSDDAPTSQRDGPMKTSNLRIVLLVVYLVLVGLCIAYELSIRIYDPGSSEFAGTLSVGLTLPASLLIFFFSAVFHFNPAATHATFAIVLGLCGLLNACLICLVVRIIQKPDAS